MDFYQILGIDHDATQEDIKEAYKKKAMGCHPDRGGDEESFNRIKDAYAVLGDPAKRNYYDASQKRAIQGEILIDLDSPEPVTRIKMGMGTVEVRRVK